MAAADSGVGFAAAISRCTCRNISWYFTSQSGPISRLEKPGTPGEPGAIEVADIGTGWNIWDIGATGGDAIGVLLGAVVVVGAFAAAAAAAADGLGRRDRRRRCCRPRHRSSCLFLVLLCLGLCICPSLHVGPAPRPTPSASLKCQRPSSLWRPTTVCVKRPALLAQADAGRIAVWPFVLLGPNWVSEDVLLLVRKLPVTRNIAAAAAAEKSAHRSDEPQGLQPKLSAPPSLPRSTSPRSLRAVLARCLDAAGPRGAAGRGPSPEQTMKQLVVRCWQHHILRRWAPEPFPNMDIRSLPFHKRDTL
mmetsp:Transcript_4737/g.11269  ORF Transcript_4737/g.11269 Transcript_4737/m.11269 type:complete len:305 (+) Transcript_4737:600-1514(+)